MIPGFIAAFLGMAALIHVAPFPFLLDLGGGNRIVWRMPHPPGDKAVYLTYDDGPNPAVTPLLLDLLREKEVRATFFVIEDHVTGETAPILRRMFHEGHSVGLHSADRWLMMRSADRIARTLRLAAARIESHAGSRPCGVFRSHAGWRGISMLRALQHTDFKFVGWSWGTWDWCGFRRRTPERVARQIVKHASPGKIIVIHDGHHRNPKADRLYAVEATRRIIDTLRAEGYAFKSLCPP